MIDDLATQRTVLFLGAGVSASARTRTGGSFKDWDTFLSHAADVAGGEIEKQAKEFLRQKEYLLSCELLKNALADRWDGLVVDEYGQAAEASPLHAAIVALDPRVIITTNFDRLLETTWQVTLGSSAALPIVLTGTDDEVFRCLRDRRNRYLLKIHGTVDKPGSIVFAKTQYVETAFNDWRYSSLLESILLNYTVMFVGFSMSDPAITQILEQYAMRYSRARPHYAFMSAPVPPNIEEINRRLRKLSIIQYDPADHHANLPKLIMDLSVKVAERKREIAAQLLVESERVSS